MVSMNGLMVRARLCIVATLVSVGAFPLLFGAASLSVGASLFATPAYADNGMCRWEGGLGISAECKAQDCIEQGGLAICSAPLPVAIVPYNQADDDKFTYRMCAQIPHIGQGYDPNLFKWCTAQGGTMAMINGSPYCQGLTPDFGGATQKASNEGSALSASDQFAALGVSANCPMYNKADSGWGFVGTGDNQCWNAPNGPTILNGEILSDTRQLNYDYGQCGNPFGIKIAKERGLACAEGEQSRYTPNGVLQCIKVITTPPACCPTDHIPNALTEANPVLLTTLAKVHQEVVYRADDGLEFTLFYNSQGRYHPQAIGSFLAAADDYWRQSYSRRLYPISGLYTMAIVQREDASLQPFDADGKELFNYDGAAARLQNLGSAGWRLTLANSDVEQYDDGGHLMSVTTRAGVVTTLTYNAQGGLWKISNSFGRALTLAYDGEGNLQSVTTPENTQILFGHDRKRLKTVTFPDSTSKTFHYEHTRNEWLMTGITDEDNVRFATYTYDPSGGGRVDAEEHAGGVEKYQFSLQAAASTPTTATWVVDPVGRTRLSSALRVNGVYKFTAAHVFSPNYPQVTLSYFDANGNRTFARDFSTHQTFYTYDQNRNLEVSRIEGTYVSEPYPDSRTIKTEWHPTYRLPTLKSVYLGNSAVGTPLQTTSYTYDTSGNRRTQTITDPATSTSRTWTYTYNEFGQVLTADGPRTDVNDVTTYTYYTCSSGNECGQVHTITNALEQTTTFDAYNANGQPLSITDANGVQTILTYDLRQRLKSRTVGSEVSTFAYWPTGLLKNATLPDGSFIAYTYDPAHRLTRIEDKDGNYIVYTLDNAGKRTKEDVFDPSSVLTRTRSRVFYDYGLLSKEIGAANTAEVTTSYGYNEEGNIATVNAPMGRNSANYYDNFKRLMQANDPAGGSTKFKYNVLHQLISVTDPRNLQTTYKYNALGDLTSQVSPDTGTTQNTHDSAGNLKTSTDARNQQVTYDYDALNRVTQAAYSDQTLGYTYDQGSNAKGRLTLLTNNAGSVSYQYTSLGRIASKTQSMGGVSKTVGYGYNPQGQLSSLTTPSGQAITYSYTNGLLAGISVNNSAVVSQIKYLPFGPPSEWTWGNGQLTQRKFDLDGRITSNSDAGATSYTYHPDNSIATQTNDSSANLNIPLGVTTFGVSTSSNRLDGVTGALARVYQYDTAGNTLSDGVRSFTYDSMGRMGTAQNNGITSYAYNALDQRVRKSNSTGTTYFVYDESGHLVGEYDVGGALIQELVWLDDMPVASIRANEDGNGIGVFYIHTDHLNAPTKLTRSTDNAVVWRWDHDPFGNGIPNEDPDGNGLYVTFNLRFPGQYYDTETALHYNYFRDYDPNTGRYVQSDPIGLGGGVNTYSYVGGNTLNYYDPYGLLSMDDVWGAIYQGTGGWTPSQNSVNFGGGFGDVVTFGLTKQARRLLGLDNVNECSNWYTAGEATGIAASIAVGGAAGWEAAGTKGAGKEFSHWIPNRMGGPRSLWNGNYVTPARHYLHDPFRYPRGWRELGEKWHPVVQQFDRIPNVYKGAGAGGAATSAGAFINNEKCGCTQ